MTVKNKVIIAFSSFVLLMVVLGTWVYIALDTAEYKPKAPVPVSSFMQDSTQSQVTVIQIPQQQLDDLLSGGTSSTASADE